MTIIPVPNVIGGEIRKNPLNQNFTWAYDGMTDLQAQIDSNDVEIANRYTKSEVDAKDANLQTQINNDKTDLANHLSSLTAHDATEIVNNSSVVGVKVSDALNTVQQQVNALVVGGTTNTTIGIYSLTATGSANAYIGTFASLTYFGGLKLNVTFNTKNTGASTFNLNSLGVKNIKIINANNVKQDLSGGELIGVKQLQYDGTDFILIQETLSNTTSTVSASLATPIVSVTDSYSGVCDVSVKGKTTVNGLGTLGKFGVDTNADGLADGWTGSNAGAFSLANGEQTFTPTAQYGDIRTTANIVSGRLYTFIANVKSVDNNVTLSISGSSSSYVKQNSGSGNFEKIGIIATGGYFPYIATTKTSAFVPITVKQAFYVDVTDYPELVGLTNQQKLDWCLANLEYCDGMDSVRNVEVESVGKNLFDISGNINEEILPAPILYNEKINENTFRAYIDGSMSNGRGQFRKVKPNTDYKLGGSCLLGGTATGFFVGVVNKANTILTIGFNTFNSGNNTEVFIVFVKTGGGDNKNGWADFSNIQLEEGTNATAYEPFKNSILSVTCTDPTKFALSNLLNGVENKLELTQGEWKATKNISGVVNLLSGVVINSTNLVGSLNGGAYTLLQSNGVQSSGLINGSFTTTATATIIYQLATPVTIPFEDFDSNGIYVNGLNQSFDSRTQFSLSSDTITPNVDIVYPLDVGASLQQLSDEIIRQREEIDDIYGYVPVKRDISCGIPQSVTIANATSVIPELTLSPRHIVNGLGSIGNFRKDTNADGLADGWIGENAGTFSLVNGEQTFTPTALYGGIRTSTAFSITAGRIICAISFMKTIDNTGIVDALVYSSKLAQKVNTGSNNYEKIGILFQSSGSTSIFGGQTAKTSGFVPITVKQAFYVDVTDYPELVGLTNQQKLDWCLANLQYCDGIGVTKNPTVKVTHPDSTISYTTIQGDFLTGDEISILNGETFGNKLWSSKKVLYGKDYTFGFNADFTGYKRFVSPFPTPTSGTSNSVFIKYDSKIVKYTTSWAGADEYETSTTNFYLTIADTDTGFTETLNPNDDEVKAFMNGWKATANNGTRYTAWVSVVDGTTVPTSQTIEFVKSNLAPNYEGYQLYYKYATAKSIDDTSRSYLAPINGDEMALLSGINSVTLIDGVVKGEVAKPVGDGVNYFINGVSPNSSECIYKVESFGNVYKNGVVDTNWTYFASYNIVRGNGYMRCPIANFDTSATYTVDYTILSSIAPQIGSGSLSYKEGLVETVNDLAQIVDGKQDKNVAIDNLIDASVYEKLTIGRYANQLLDGGTLYIECVIPCTKKNVLPIINLKSFRVLSGSDYTNDCIVNSRSYFGTFVRIVFRTTNATLIANRNNGIITEVSLELDCRGVI